MTRTHAVGSNTRSLINSFSQCFMADFYNDASRRRKQTDPRSERVISISSISLSRSLSLCQLFMLELRVSRRCHTHRDKTSELCTDFHLHFLTVSPARMPTVSACLKFSLLLIVRWVRGRFSQREESLRGLFRKVFVQLCIVDQEDAKISGCTIVTLSEI